MIFRNKSLLKNRHPCRKFCAFLFLCLFVCFPVALSKEVPIFIVTLLDWPNFLIFVVVVIFKSRKVDILLVPNGLIWATDHPTSCFEGEGQYESLWCSLKWASGLSSGVPLYLRTADLHKSCQGCFRGFYR